MNQIIKDSYNFTFIMYQLIMLHTKKRKIAIKGCCLTIVRKKIVLLCPKRIKNRV